MDEVLTTTDTSAEACRLQVEILRRKTLEERLRAALDMAEVARTLLERGIRLRHPEYTDRQVRLALHRALLPGPLFAAAFPGQEDLPP